MDGRTVNGAVLDAPATTPPFATLAAGAGRPPLPMRPESPRGRAPFVTDPTGLAAVLARDPAPGLRPGPPRGPAPNGDASGPGSAFALREARLHQIFAGLIVVIAIGMLYRNG